MFIVCRMSGALFYHCLPSSLETGSPNKTGMRLEPSSSSDPPGSTTTSACVMSTRKTKSGFLCECWDLNSVHHHSMQILLPTEPSSQLLLYILNESGDRKSIL